MNGPIKFTEVRWRPSDSEGVWEVRRLNENQKSIYIEGTDRGIEYVIEARNVGPTGLSSNWVSVLHTPVLLNRPLTPLLIDGTTGAVEVDCKVEEQFSLLLSRDVTSVSFTNVPEEKIVIIVVVQGGAFGIAWPDSVVFESGEPYVPTQLLGRADTIGLATVSSGTQWVLKSSVDVDTTGDGTIPGGGNPEVPPGVTPMTVTLDKQLAASSCDAFGGVPCAPSVQIVATPADGVPPYTAVWTQILGPPVVVVSSLTALDPVFSLASGATAENVAATFRVTVSDSTGFAVSKTADVQLARTTHSLTISSPGSVSGLCTTVDGGSCNPSVASGVVVSGGTPPYSALWTYKSGSLVPKTVEVTNVAATFRVGPGRFAGEWDTVWNLVVTDAAGAVREIDLAIHLSREVG